MTQPLISFIIAYHNEPLPVIKECINSILTLRLKSEEREIIVVDDGSVLSPANVLHELSEEIIYLHQENLGLSVARNNGIEHAHGEYIQFVDSDDALIAPVYNQLIEKIRYEKVDILMYRFTFNKQSFNDDFRMKVFTSGSKFLQHNNLRGAACVYLFRKEILNGLQFKPGIYHEDMLFTPLLILRANNLITTKAEAYFYRQHSRTIMSSTDKKHIEKRLDDFFSILIELKNTIKQLPEKDIPAIQRCLYQQVMVHLYSVFTLKNIKEMRIEGKKLRENGLFPLPLRFYTLKYYIFALISRFI